MLIFIFVLSLLILGVFIMMFGISLVAPPPWGLPTLGYSLFVTGIVFISLVVHFSHLRISIG